MSVPAAWLLCSLIMAVLFLNVHIMAHAQKFSQAQFLEVGLEALGPSVLGHVVSAPLSWGTWSRPLCPGARGLGPSCPGARGLGPSCPGARGLGPSCPGARGLGPSVVSCPLWLSWC